MARDSRPADGYVAGRHHRYIWGHFRYVLPAGFGPDKGVAFAEVAAVFDMIWDELGLLATAAAIGVSPRQASNYRNRHVPVLQKTHAEAIERAWARLNRGPVQAIVPTEPIRAWLAANHRSVRRAWPKKSRFARAVWRPAVSIRVADELACSLGVHPSEIWPDWYELQEDIA